jgi:vacuolar-type H+-ATPase subunit E/Vma4
MRTSIPEAVRQAERIQQEQERLIAQAKEEADRIVVLANERAAKMVDEHEVIKAAQVRADAIIEKARHDATVTQQGANDYAAEVLSKLEEQLSSYLNIVRNGLNLLRSERDGGGRPPDSSKP